jgi:hypothetical protein
MSTATVYQVETADQANSLRVTEVAKPVGDWDQYASLSTVTAGQRVCLLGFKSAAGELDVYEFTGAAPCAKLAGNKIQIGVERDIVNTFMLGNRPHLAVYKAKNGIFEIYALGDDLALSAPLQYFRNHEPAITKNFTTVKFFTSFGQVVMLGYDFASGYVAAYTLAATATSPGGVPPIMVTPAWSHMWAPGWTRFAFFQYGGANFFLKTNTAKPNVNIDHINDVLSMGTVEIGSKLNLPDAQTLNNVEPFVLGGGDPYFVTYVKSTGQAVLYRFRGDCLGWIAAGKVSSQTNAGLVTPVTMPDGEVFLLVG